MTSITNDRQLQKLVREAADGQKIRVAAGLFIRKRPGGSASWVLVYQLDGKRREQGLGGYPTITLADAREQAAALRKQVKQGTDTIEAKRQIKAQQATEKARAITFDEVAGRYIEAHRAGWRNEKHAQQWTNTLRAYATPVIGGKAVAEITLADVLDVLNPIWQSKPETASRVRNRIELVLDAAAAQGLRDGDNPARWRGKLDKLLPKRSKVAAVRHHPALPWQEMPEFWQKLTASSAFGARALQLTILTACRTREVIGARWAEIDLEARTWRIPAERMKAAREHAVPLSDAACAILRAQQGKHDVWVFPGGKGGRRRSPDGKRLGDTHMSTGAMDAVLSRLKRTDITVHGFRSTFRDWSGEATHHPRDVCEQALAHVLTNKAEAAYRRGEMLEKRRVLMAEWATYATTKRTGNVVRLSKRAAK